MLDDRSSSGTAGLVSTSGDVRAFAEAIGALPDLGGRQLDADRLLAAEGAGHIVHDLPIRADGRMVALESRPWRLDPVPYVLDGDDFTALADAAVARMRMLESILRDVYGAQSLLADAVVEPQALWGSLRYRLAAFGPPAPKRWLTNYAVDVVRTTDGRWRAVRDLTDAPPGVGYALLDRLVAARVHRDVVAALPAGRALRSLDPFADRLRDALADVANTANPRVVVLSGGVDHPSFVEQSYLATRLGLNLAEGADLVVRQRRVWLRSLAGLEPVDVLFRRLEDDQLDPMEVNASGHVGIPGVLLAARSDGLVLSNAHGTGVLEEPLLADQWDAAGAWLTGHGSDYQGVAPLEMCTAEERASLDIARIPSFIGGASTQRRVTLRLHLVAGDKGIDVLQGGSARVLADGDDPTSPTAATAKDVWVIGGRIAPPVVRRREPLPQVDLIASVPTRAAEALFWAGRSMERAELVARSLEVVLDRTDGAFDADVAESWVAPAIDLVMSIAGVPLTSLPEGGNRSAVAVGSSVDALSRHLGSFLAEVSSVREFFSVTAGRVFARLAESRSGLGALVDQTVDQGALDVGRIDIGRIDGRQLETVLVDLASMVGLWNESVVRGPAWRFGEIGRRIERALGVVDGVRGVFRPFADAAPSWLTEPRVAGMDDEGHRTDFARQRVVEIVLAANESLVAYRRRYRSDVEFEPAVRLVVAERLNPRSAAAAMEAIRHEATGLGWDEGVDVAVRVLDTLASASFADVASTAAALDAVWTGCDELSRAVVGEYLSAPLDPRMMGGA